VFIGRVGQQLHASEGVIERAYWTGHGDFPEFTMRTPTGEVKARERFGDHTLYVEGLAIRLSWVEQHWAQPHLHLGDPAQVVIHVEIEESDLRSAAEGRSSLPPAR
jgi:hypothetical protein